ncbi:MAG TPA: YbaN family protein [Thermoplasmata archaeon]|nr:YbaN family protein [Thermoplasmata archaeon]
MRCIWTVTGTFFLALGLIGIVVPLLPTTPFLLLAAACYLRGSRRMYRWLLTNRIFGRYLRDYREKRGIPMKVKIATLSLLWATIAFTAFIVLQDLIVQIILLAIAAAVTMHILLIKTARENRESL